jgi:hypothetical protein
MQMRGWPPLRGRALRTGRSTSAVSTDSHVSKARSVMTVSYSTW